MDSIEERRRVDTCDNDYLEVTRDGNVFHNGYKLKKCSYGKTGYLYVSHRKKNYLIHRLVASAYICNLKRGDRHIQVHHKNEDKTDNRVENLEVLTVLEHQHQHKQKYPIEKKCVVCGNVFTPNKTKRKRQQTCSYLCKIELMKYKSEQRKRKIQQYSLNGELVNEWNSARDAQNSLGIHESNINKCCNGHIKTYKGYVWQYVEGDRNE